LAGWYPVDATNFTSSERLIALKNAADKPAVATSIWLCATSAIASCPATIGVSVALKPASRR
jgi:hypothetical protein